MQLTVDMPAWLAALLVVVVAAIVLRLVSPVTVNINSEEE